ncbi:MAG TPA: HD family hydrolase [Pyrinomonadaceae bacterium]|jgi:putative hydrolase of HD superfamily|nr:HD family hydrolase [Pyrinomonadaceae bacterium]
MISTLIELQRLKRLERTGWTLRGLAPGAESVAAHSFGVALAAMMMADELISRGVHVDVERLLRMALLHDWAEARTGDMPRTGGEYFGAQARRTAERAAFDDIVSGLGEKIETRYSELHEDYEHRASLEARLVKAADIIDLLVQALAFERAGVRGLDEFWDGVAERDFQLEGAANEVFREALRLLLKERSELK